MWTAQDDVVEVPEELGAELRSIPGAGFAEAGASAATPAAVFLREGMTGPRA
ncbi:hypothetical protein AB0H73_16080 [Streptomyces olivoreticuli]